MLPYFGFSRTLRGMEVHFTPDTQAQLNQFAARQGKAAEQVAEETVARMLGLGRPGERQGTRKLVS